MITKIMPSHDRHCIPKQQHGKKRVQEQVGILGEEGYTFADVAGSFDLGHF